MSEYNWQFCDDHNETYAGDEQCPYCRISELETLLTEYKDAEHRAVKERGESLKRISELESALIEAEADWEEERRRVRELEAEIEEVHYTGGCSYIRLNKAKQRISELEVKYEMLVTRIEAVIEQHHFGDSVPKTLLLQALMKEEKELNDE